MGKTAGKTFRIENKEWVECKAENIVDGDVFRAYHSNGHKVKTPLGKYVSLAISDAIETQEDDGSRVVTIKTWKAGDEILDKYRR